MTTTTTVSEIETIASKLAAIPEFQEKECGIIGRRTEMQLLIVCIVARLHPLFQGAPGIAKSMTVDGVRRHFPEMTQFKTQAYKASPPEQFIGQISLKGMANDEFYRLVGGKAPDAQLVVIDEFPRAPRAVLPVLQGIMVEREFDSGRGVEPVPLESLIGTSNHIPDDPELEALFDRFTFKILVEGPQSQEQFLAIMQSARKRRLQGLPQVPDELLVTQQELKTFQAYVPTVVVPRSLELKMAELWADVLALGIMPSPRRWQDLEAAMQAQAAIDGRDECLDDDLQIAQHALFNRPEDFPAVYQCVVKQASTWVKNKAETVGAFQDTLDRLGQIQAAIAKGGDSRTQLALAGDDPDSKKSLLDHGLTILAEHDKIRELIAEQIRTASGRDVSDLEAILTQMEAGREWMQDRLAGGLRL